MRSYTYGTLNAELQSYAEDFDMEFVSKIPSLISQGESRAYGDLGLDTMMVENLIALPTGVTDATLPTNCISPQEIRYGSDAGPLLRERTVAFVNSMREQYAAGDPQWWAPVTVRTVRVAPARPSGADPSEQLSVRHSAPEEQLDSTDSSSTTWISTVFGDLLLFACLLAAESFNKHPEGEAARTGQYATFLTQAQGYLEGRARTNTRV